MASNNRMDLLAEARLALLLQRARLDSFTEINAKAALSLVTLDGARALGVHHEIGSLEPGKAADLAAFPLDDVGPVHDPISSAIFALPGTRASFVSVAGEVLVRDGKLLDVDADLEQRVQRSADVLQAWLEAQH
jgi:5-methylthioadenosine/S-adenosylhomocysteine deaminase